MKQTPTIECDHKNLGFTLIELMLVIAVIGILAIVSVPKYKAVTEHYKLESSAQIVVGQLRYAKQLAMDQRIPIYVAMDTNTVEVLDEDDKAYGGLQGFDSGVNFDILSAETNGLIVDEPGRARGLPHVLYDGRGFVKNPSVGDEAINIVLSTLRTGQSVVIVIELETGNITLKW